MAPELLHIEGGSAAGDVQRQLRVVIGPAAVHAVHAHAAVMAHDLLRAGGDLLRRQAQIVHAQQVEIQVQGGGALDQLLVDIGAAAVLGAVAVVVGQALLVQIEVGHVHLQMGQHRAVRSRQGHAVAGDGDVDGYRIRRRLIVAVLSGIPRRAGLHRNGEAHGRRAALLAGGRHRGGIGARSGVGKVQRLVTVGRVGCDLGLGAVIAVIQRIGQLVARGVGKHLGQVDGQLLAGLDRIGGGRIGGRSHAAGGKSQLRHHGQAQDQCQKQGRHTLAHAFPVVHVNSSLYESSLSPPHTRIKG